MYDLIENHLRRNHNFTHRIWNQGGDISSSRYTERSGIYKKSAKIQHKYKLNR